MIKIGAAVACFVGTLAAFPAFLPQQNEPPAKVVINAPLPEPLSRGVVVIQYRVQNLHIAPIFGPAAAAISPRIGHIHVTVDDNIWHWADASGNPVIITGLPPGRHRVLIQVENPNHQELDKGIVEFRIPNQSK